VEGQGEVTIPKKFSYVESSTPLLQDVYPAASFGGLGTMLNFYGAHRITNLGGGLNFGDIYGIYIGDSLCTRQNIYQDDDGFQPNSLRFVQA